MMNLNPMSNCAYRGNSIATKAMEAYIKMVGEKYLEGTLAPTLHDILASNCDLEVDPVKVNCKPRLCFSIGLGLL
jgi:hypothetical protein